MKSLGLFSKNDKQDKKDGDVWSPHEDQPLSLMASSQGDTVNGQKVLVLGFAVIALGGAAYLGASAFAHNDATSASFAVTEANAVTLTPLVTPKPVAQADLMTVQATEKSDRPVEMPGEPHVETTETVGAITPSRTISDDDPMKPKPVKVQRITPDRTPAEPSSETAVAIPTQTDQRWAHNVVAPAASAPSQNAITQINAYAASRGSVSEGIEAVMREAAASEDKPNERPKKIVARASIPEMAGSTALPGRSARIRSAVKLRSGPGDETGVLAVIPSNTTVSVASGCRHWCRVSFNGRNGYVYKNFLR